MGNTTLYLVHHGQTLFNVEKRFQGRLDSPLTELGKEGALLEGTCLHAAYASPLPRTMATARLLLEKRGVRLQTDERLREINRGPLEGIGYEEALEKYPKAARAFWERPPRL